MVVREPLENKDFCSQSLPDGSLLGGSEKLSKIAKIFSWWHGLAGTFENLEFLFPELAGWVPP
jgi:hypothetical protein